MKAVRVPATGPATVIDLAEPTDDDTAAFLADLYSAIGCDSVECVQVTGLLDAWLDETGLINGKPLNPRATQLANTYGISDGLHGVVLFVGTDPDNGEPADLTDAQVDQVMALPERHPPTENSEASAPSPARRSEPTPDASPPPPVPMSATLPPSRPGVLRPAA